MTNIKLTEEANRKPVIGDMVRYTPESFTGNTSAAEYFFGVVNTKIRLNEINYVSVNWILALGRDGIPVNVNTDFIPKLVSEDSVTVSRPEGLELTLKNPVEILFAKTRENAVIPEKRREDAGFDFYACFDEDAMVIEPGETKMISTGIATCCDVDYFYMAKERGSTGTKGMALRCGVIDSGYRNEWFICYTNTTKKPLVIAKESVRNNYSTDEYLVYPYEKAIAQGVLLPNIDVVSREIPYEELKAIPSERGLGKIGSSAK